KREDVGDDLNGGVGSAIYRVKEAFVPKFSSWLRRSRRVMEVLGCNVNFQNGSKCKKGVYEYHRARFRVRIPFRGKREDVGDDLNGGVGSAIYRVKEAFVPKFSSWLR
nr:hypothetical protein [Tanacetum cinerariifolium]